MNRRLRLFLTASMVVGAGFGAAAIAGALPVSGGDSGGKGQQSTGPASTSTNAQERAVALRAKRGPRGPRGPRGATGPAGPAGPAGIAGLQRVKGTLTAAPMGSAYAIYVDCAAGGTAIAGGVRAATGGIYMYESYPSPDNASRWITEFEPWSFANVEAFTTCASTNSRRTGSTGGGIVEGESVLVKLESNSVD